MKPSLGVLFHTNRRAFDFYTSACSPGNTFDLVFHPFESEPYFDFCSFSYKKNELLIFPPPVLIDARSRWIGLYRTFCLFVSLLSRGFSNFKLWQTLSLILRNLAELSRRCFLNNRKYRYFF